MKKRLFRYLTILSCFILSGFTYANEIEANPGENDSESNQEDITDEEVIPFREFTNYYCEGTEWYYFCHNLSVNEDHTELYFELIKGKTWLEGEYEFDGKKYLRIYTQILTDDSEPAIEGYVRTENNKILYTTGKPEDSEILMFDFNLAPGESCVQYFGMSNYIGEGIYMNDITYTCLSNDKYYDAKRGGLPYMEMEWEEHYTNLPWDDDEIPEFKGIVNWMPGIGSWGGIVDPQYQNKVLYAVYSNGVALFDNEPSVVEQLIDENNKTLLKGNKYHLDGRVFKEGDRGISISRGKKVISN